MELRDLTYFLQVASSGHLRRAADSLGLTQPALTKGIARLERELNVQLFERTPKGVTLTLAGMQLVKHATRLRAAVEEAKREFKDLLTGESGHLRIGSGVSLAQDLIPTACTALLEHSPGITFEIATGTGQKLISALRDGHLDLVVSGVGEKPDTDLRHDVIMVDEILVIARRTHSLHRARRVSFKDLAGQRWVLSRSGSLLMDWFNHCYREAGLKPPVAVVETDSLSTQLSLVSNSNLLSFQSWTSIRHSPWRESLRPLASSPLVWRRRVGVTYREHGYLPEAARKLIEILGRICARNHAQPRNASR